MKKSRIVVVASGHIPSEWAHSINTVRHTHAFKKLGHEVELLSVGRYVEEKLLKNVNINDFYGTDDISVRLFKDKSIYYFLDSFPRLMHVLRRYTKNTLSFYSDPERNMSQFIMKAGFDFCFARNYRIVQHNVENKIPTILESHNSTPEQSYDLLNTLKLSKSKYFLGVVTIHEKIKEKFITLGFPSEKIITLQDAVDLEKFDSIPDDINENREVLSLPKDKKIIMYCGSLKPGKGINVILNTAVKLQNDSEIIFYVLGGTQKEIHQWKRFGERHYKNVIFVGFVNGSLVPRYLKSADIVFIPYDIHEKKKVMDLNTTSPIKVFEYMASKRPILGTDVAVLNRLFFDKNAAVLVSSDYDKVIKSLLDDRVRCEEIASNAYELARSYTYKLRCERIIDHFV